MSKENEIILDEAMMMYIRQVLYIILEKYIGAPHLRNGHSHG